MPYLSSFSQYESKAKFFAVNQQNPDKLKVLILGGSHALKAIARYKDFGWDHLQYAIYLAWLPKLQLTRLCKHIGFDGISGGN
jgi:hypothetical protein